MEDSTRLYDFTFRGLLAEQALDVAGRRNRPPSAILDDEYAKALSIDSLDPTLVAHGRLMATVYTAVSSFESSVRKLIKTVLLEQKGENWWEAAVSEKIRGRAAQRQKDEEKVKWHTQRGDDPITYTQLPDLGNIIRQNWDCFQPYIHSAEWADSIFDVIERSRNVIMHSGTLARPDVDRLGIFIRDWVKQVGG
jgi:Swt1-like HEPN